MKIQILSALKASVHTRAFTKCLWQYWLHCFARSELSYTDKTISASNN